MMRMANIKMTTVVKKSDLIKTLKNNLARHAGIVQEARNGYIHKAKASLERTLEKLRKGELVSLAFSLRPPEDYSEVYKNSLAMLEWNMAETVELAADEFRQLVRDEWDWTDAFFGSNSTYSKQAQDWMSEKAVGSLVPPPE